MPVDSRISNQIAQRDAGADRHSIPVRNAAQLGDAAQTDQRPRHLLATLHVRQEIGAAGDEHRAAARRRCEQLGGLLHRARRVEREVRQSHHDATPSGRFDC